MEFDIPSIAPPSLESILWDIESEEGSDNASVHSIQSVTNRFRSMLYHCILKGVSSQVSSAGVTSKDILLYDYLTRNSRIVPMLAYQLQ